MPSWKTFIERQDARRIDVPIIDISASLSRGNAGQGIAGLKAVLKIKKPKPSGA
jgi:hypothetical protein